MSTEKTIAVLDYDAGNLKSVQNALEHIGQKAIITRDADEIMRAAGVILPGVGAFGSAMEKLKRYGLVDVIQKVVREQKPFLGICLGLQLMFESSDESPEAEGLSLLPGKILHIPEEPGLKIPHIGWNSLKVSEKSRLLKNLPEQPYVYFVHSYYLAAENPEDVAATTEYGTLIHAAVEHGNVFACQFHPEKSGETGLQILKNFAEML